MAGDTYVPRRPPELPRSERSPAPRRNPRPPRWVFHVRRIAALLILLLLIFGLVRACGALRDDVSPEPTPTETTSSAAPATTPTPTTTEAAPAEPPEIIDQSRPVEMRIPAVNLTAKFEDGDCRVVDGKIDPEPLGKACAYTSVDKPYQLPGTHTSDVVVLAGHAAAGVPAVFDKLYNPSAEEHTLKVGDVLSLIHI